MRKMMVIFAHPDDEGAIAGTLHHYAQHETEIILVCATRGEVGQISDPSLATPEILGEVRQKELEAACAVLGIQHLEFLNYRDSGMIGTPENDDPRALIQADDDEIIGKITSLINNYKPDITITFEPFGWYGHPDHQAISRWVTQVFSKMQNEQRLFHAVIPFSKFRTMIQEAIDGGFIEKNDDGDDAFPEEQQLETEARVTHKIDVKTSFDIKQEAMAKHRTQFAEDHMFRRIPRHIMLKASGIEHFIQVYPSPSETLSQNRLSDLFAES